MSRLRCGSVSGRTPAPAGEALELVRLTVCQSTNPPSSPGTAAAGRPGPSVGHTGPKVLLLDEPWARWTSNCANRCSRSVRIPARAGITFVIVTHDQDEALTLCDRLGWFNTGRIEQIGAAREGSRESRQPLRRVISSGRPMFSTGTTPNVCWDVVGAWRGAPERIQVLLDGDAPPAGMRTTEATVDEVVYAGPITRVAARDRGGLRADGHAVQRRRLPPSCGTAPR